MSDEDLEIALSTSVAAMLCDEWQAYWDVARQETERIDRELATRRASKIGDVVARVTHAEDSFAWHDERLVVATQALAGLSDGYAIMSVEWDDGLPVASLPHLDTTVQTLRSNHVLEWCLQWGYPLPIEPKSDVIADRSASEFGSWSDIDYDGFELDRLRGDEQHDWRHFTDASRDAATRLYALNVGYKSALDHYARSGTPGRFLKEIRRQGQWPVTHEIAHLRRMTIERKARGAQAEAIIATAFSLIPARSMYLLTTASSPIEVEHLSLMPLDFLDNLLERAGLDSWLAEWLDLGRLR